jgi:truncated hemoglobin YjbI
MLLMSKRYDGRPVPAHVKIPDLDRPHFERWLKLFRGAARDLCPPDAAALFVDRIEGSYANVVGLPVEELHSRLLALGRVAGLPWQGQWC